MALPTIVALIGAGGAAVAVLEANSTDTAGIMTLTTAAGRTTASLQLSLTFGAAYTTAPFVLISPCNAVAASLTTNQTPFAATTAGSVTLTSGSVVLPIGPTSWYYFVVQ